VSLSSTIDAITNPSECIMERRVGHVDDVKIGEMKEVMVGETPVLLMRLDGGYRALGARCPHYGARLVDGLLHDGRITCPWHHACFDALTGDLIEPPAIDALAKYGVRISGDDVLVDVPDAPESRRTLPATFARLRASDDVIAIVGAGAAGYMAAQTIRECGDQRPIVMITSEDRPPYDRPNLSKDYLNGHADPAWMPLRPSEFFEQNGIELLQGVAVDRLDVAGRAIELSDGRSIAYAAALIASGCQPRRLDVPGSDLDRVLTLRSFRDADAIIAEAQENHRVVVIGAGFIAMEAASSLAARGMKVTVVAPDAVPFERTLGQTLGELLQSEHERNGVDFRLGRSVACIEGRRDRLVVLDDGERLPCDLVVVGIGVAPATGFARELKLDRNGGIIVDAMLRAAEAVYAAGDIAAFPDPRGTGQIRVEHWRTAMQLGRVAGFNIAGRERRFDGIPFFWTQQFDATIRYVGHAPSWEEVVLRGDVAERRFIAYYVNDGRVHAAATMGRDRDAIAIAEQIRRSGFPTLDAVPQ